ncbi:MAG TPA: hypothetical protein VML75_03665 [Kofleriaceae bacterium]|nr:hypothetical protein [Kofleriaceae bacterium]
MRLQESEARARVEAQAKLEQDRLVQEMELRRLEANKKRPTGLIVAAVLLVFVVGGLAWFLIASQKESDSKLAKEREQARQAQVELERKLDALQQDLDTLNEEMAKAQETINNQHATQEEREAAQERLKQLQDRAKNTRDRIKNTKPKTNTPKDNTIKINPKCITEPNHPDC